MATLYKRFIPPKAPPAPPSSITSASQPAFPPKTDHVPPENKRKRERSEEEVAERKAKKLRKKGIEPAEHAIAEQKTVNDQAGARLARQPEKEPDVDSYVDEGPEDAVPKGESKSEFSHIKNIKKRRKLEKEAREARKAAKREEKGDGSEAQIDGEGRSEAGQHVEPQPTGVAPETNEMKSGQGATSGDANAVENEVEVEVEVEVAKPKKTKKKRKEKSEDVVAAERDGPALLDDQVKASGSVSNESEDAVPERGEKLEAAEAQETAALGAHPKKRRHRLEAVLQQVSPPASEDLKQDGNDDDEHLRKHGSVMTKFQKSAQRAHDLGTLAEKEEEEAAEQPVLRDLGPIPMPEKAPSPDFVPDGSALPKWLARPQVVPADSKATFQQLGLDAKTVGHLAGLHFNDALPVQQAMIPLLLPPGTAGASFVSGTESILPDLAVSAATGSGKTIAYLLPMIESLKQGGQGVGRLEALVVVPTRELVLQVAAVAESLAKGSHISIGMATGNTKLKEEQEKLVHRSQRHDPQGYAALMEKAHRRNYPPAEDDDSFDEYVDGLEKEDAREEQLLDDAVQGLVDHVPVYRSTVDILICTPGRVLEHISSTLGFTLAHLHWLVLDEADKLLDQQYDGFLETVNAELTRERTLEEQDARERYLRTKSAWNEQHERRVRKVVLSATMTRDISKLAELRLNRPRMVIVSGKDSDATQAAASAEHAQDARSGAKEIGDGFELPRTLVEYCVPVGDGSEKPLHLINLLQDKLMPVVPVLHGHKRDRQAAAADGDDTTSDSDSDMDSDSSSDLSSSSEEPSDDSSDEEVSPASSAGPSAEAEQVPDMHPARAALFASKSTNTEVPTILIFTSSTEATNRLAHLLKSLKPEWSSYITTLTKSASSNKLSALRRDAKASTKPSITISTDRSSRGLDTLAANRSITHVVQYDVPRSLTSYVHRVGRTARAGRNGEAWTLYTHAEARWFLHEVTRVASVRRAQEVEKVKILVEDQGLKERFEEVLEGMRETVYGGSLAARASNV